MPIDPQIAAMFAHQPAWPPARKLPLETLRKAVRDSSIAIPGPDVKLASVEDHTIAGPGGALPLRIYKPEGDGPFPVIVYFHGGGWVVGDLDTQDVIARSFAAGAESIVVSVGYRLAPENPFPAAPDDAWAATLWAAEHASEIGGDPAKLAVVGESAGGGLACGVALRARDAGAPRLRAQVNFYGSCNYPSVKTASANEFADGPILGSDDIDYFWSLYLSDPTQQDDYRASPIRAADHEGLPPAFIGTAECDPSRDDTDAFAAKLRAAGVEVEAKRYPGMVHGFVSWIGILQGARDAMDDANHFLRRHFTTVAAGLIQ